MIYATQDGATTVIVAAADQVADLETFRQRMVTAPPPEATRVWQPDVVEILLDPRFSGLRISPVVIVCADADAARTVVASQGLTLVPPEALGVLHQEMVTALADDPYSPDDTRLIEVIHGLTEYDPWDYRSDDQKQQDEEHRRAAEAAAKAGKLSGDSFAGGSNRGAKRDPGAARVTDIHSTRHADGMVTIDTVLAVKGLYDDNGKGVWRPLDPAAPHPREPDADAVADATPGERFYRVQMRDGSDCAAIRLPDVLADFGWLAPDAATGGAAAVAAFVVRTGVEPEGDWFDLRGALLAHKVSCLLSFDRVPHTVRVVDAAGTDIGPFAVDPAVAEAIDPGGRIAIFHRLAVAGAHLWQVLQVLGTAGIALERHVAARGQAAEGAWIACATKAGAETLAAAIRADPDHAHAEIEVHGVNDTGERLVPKGVAIVEAEATAEPPRPWNDAAAAWAAMDAAAKRAPGVRLRGAEFIFCGSDRGAGDGCVVTITPRSYFNRTGTLWDGVVETDLLPPDLKLVDVATYRTRSRDWISLNQDLNGRGMVESLKLQLHVNQLD